VTNTGQDHSIDAWERASTTTAVNKDLPPKPPTTTVKPKTPAANAKKAEAVEPKKVTTPTAGEESKNDADSAPAKAVVLEEE
jgi:hypothetical protein